jgi:hypothetical protein
MAEMEAKNQYLGVGQNRMNRKAKNKQRANKQCRKCTFLHCGEKVDHNHCDVSGGSRMSYTNPNSYDARANGRNEGKCYKFSA